MVLGLWLLSSAMMMFWLNWLRQEQCGVSSPGTISITFYFVFCFCFFVRSEGNLWWNNLHKHTKTKSKRVACRDHEDGSSYECRLLVCSLTADSSWNPFSVFDWKSHPRHPKMGNSRKTKWVRWSDSAGCLAIVGLSTRRLSRIRGNI